MRLRVLIALAVLLTPLAIWRIACTRDSAPNMSPAEIAIRKDRINGNVEGLVEKVKASPPKLARRATRALGAVGAKSLPYLKKILLEDERPAVRQQATQAVVLSVQAAAQRAKPLDSHMTDALVTAISSDNASEVRASAASALGQLYDHRNMGALLKAMDDEDPAVRRRAFEAVTRIFGRRYIFDPNSTSDKRQIVIRLIATDWEVHKKHVGEYHDRRRKSPKPRTP